MINNQIKWLLKDGTKTIDCTSFPFAYRTMYNIIRKGVESKRKFEDMANNLSIVGPVAPGAKSTTYSYATATAKATDMGLLSADGQINSREFKRNR
jgi:hypothetical protein